MEYTPWMILIGIAINYLIIYYVVAMATKASAEERTKDVKALLRIELLKLRSEGIPKDVLNGLLSESDADFSERLTSTRSPEEELKYQQELDKIRAHQTQ